MPVKRKRVSCWRHDVDAPGELSKHVALTLPIIFKEGLYTSSDFKKHVNVSYLTWMAPSLNGFVTLDKRGGYFAQTDMELAVRKHVCDGPFQKEMAKLAKKRLKSFDDAISLVAYSYRTMLAHVRLLFDQYQVGVMKHGADFRAKHVLEHPKELRDIYELIEYERSAIGGPPKRTKKEVNPFPYFRSSAPPSEPSSEEACDISSEDEILVDYEIKDGEVMKRLSNGIALKGEVKRGADGFAIAYWKDGSSFQTLIPNQNIDGDAVVEHRPWADSK